MPKECGSWRASRAQARHPPPGPAHPLHYQLTQSLPPGRLLSPRPHSCCVELARRAHTDTSVNRPCVQSAATSSASGDSAITAIQKKKRKRMKTSERTREDVLPPHLACYWCLRTSKESWDLLHDATPVWKHPSTPSASRIFHPKWASVPPNRRNQTRKYFLCFLLLFYWLSAFTLNPETSCSCLCKPLINKSISMKNLQLATVKTSQGNICSEGNLKTAGEMW